MSSPKMTALSLLMSACAVCVTSMEMGANLPDGGHINWEDFDEAISEEDCFGSNCGASSAALSMMQKPVPKAALVQHRKTVVTNEAEESAISQDMPSMEDLQGAFESEEGPDMEAVALNLVQTGASIERTSIVKSSPMAVAAQADGGFEINPQTAALPNDGTMVFSIDDHGGFHNEGISLVQAEAHIERKSVPSTEPEQVQSALKIRKMDSPNDEEMELEDKETEALSLMQTDTQFGHKRTSSAVQADGTLEMNPKKAFVPSNGMMHFSVDVNGNFHSEDQEEGFSLMQTDARVEESAPTSIEPAGHPHWSAEGSASGSGVVHLSVNGHGQFHYEM